MKKIKFLTVFTMLALSFASCKKAADIDFTTDYAATQSIHIDQTSGSAVAFNETETVEFENADTKEYLDKVQSITVNSMTYKIKNFTGDPAGILSMDLVINGTSILHNENTIVKDASDNSTEFEVTDINSLNIVATQLLNDKRATIEFSGTSLCDGGNMDFDVDLDINVTVTANPLD